MCREQANFSIHSHCHQLKQKTGCRNFLKVIQYNNFNAMQAML